MIPRRSTPFISRSSISAAFTAALFTPFAVPSAFAVTSTWVGGYATTGTWNQAAQWSEGSFTTNSDVIFNDVVGVSSTATFLGTARSVNSITFNGGAATDPAFSIRLATTGTGGTAANLTFKSGNSGITVASTDSASHSIGASDGSIILAGNLPIVHNGTGTLTINRPITDSTSSFGITKSGTGSATISAVNSYDGATTINDGILRCGVGGGSATSTVVVAAVSATHSISVIDNTKTWTCAQLAPTAAGKLEFNFAAILPSTSVSPLTVTGLADFTAATPPVSVVVSAGLVPGTYPLMTWGSTSGTAPTTAGLTVSQVTAGTAASLSISGNTLNLVIASTTPTVVKADNADNLNLGTSWVGGSAPDGTKVAKWNSTVTSANTTVLAADVSWAGIAIENPNGPVTINAGNALTLGAAVVDIDLGTATADLTLNCPLALSAANSLDVAASRTLTLGGQVSGAFGVTKLGTGTAILSSTANSYTGTTTVTAGTLKLGASNVIPEGSGKGNVSITGALDLNGNSETVNGLSGAGTIDNLAATTTSTLTAGSNDQTSTFSGILKNTGSTATLNLTKTGSGSLTLANANTFSGITTVSGGTLILGNATALGGTTGITMAGGTLLIPGLSGISIGKPITLGATGTTATITAPDVAGSGTTNFPVTLSSGISGDGNVTFSGVSTTNAYGVVNLNAASNYAGSTLITTISAYGGGAPNNANIFMNLGVVNALPITTVVTLDGGDGGGSAPGRYCELDLNGKNQTLAGLTNVTGRVSRVQRVVNNSATAATLTVNNSVDHTYSGQLGWVSGYGSTAYNNLGITKNGIGIFTVSGSRTYSGNTTVNGGTLRLGSINTNNELSTVTIAASAATLDLAYTGTDTVDKLFIGSTQLVAGVYGPSATNIPQITGTGTLTVTSGPPTGGYSGWKTANSNSQTIDLDHDGDGVSNGIEYFLFGAANTTGFTALPGVTNTSGTLSITWTKAAGYTGTYNTDFVVETSSTLTGAWTTETVGVNVTITGNDVKYTFPAGTRNFARLKVTGP